MLTGERKGASLVELLVAVAILMIGAMGVTTVSKLTSEKLKFDDAKTNEVALARLLRAQLEFSDDCPTRVRFATANPQLRDGNNRNQRDNVTPVEILVPGLLAGHNGDWVAQGQTISSGLRIDELGFNNAQFVPNSYNPPNDNVAEYLVSVRLVYSYDANKSLLGGTAGRAINIGSMIVGVTGNNLGNPGNNNNLNLVACHGVGTTSSSEDICTSLNCRWSGTQCSCATPDFDCPPGTLLTGFRAGRGVCTEVGGTCPPGQYLVGVGLGGATCRDVPIFDPGTTPAPTPTPTPACLADGSTFTATYDPNCYSTCYTGYSQQCILGTNPSHPPVGYTCSPADAAAFCTISCPPPDFSQCCSGTGTIVSGSGMTWTFSCGGAIPTSTPTPTPTPSPTPSPTPAGGIWVVKGCCDSGGSNAGCSVVLPTCQGPMLPAPLYAPLIGQPCSPYGAWMSTIGVFPVLQSGSARCE